MSIRLTNQAVQRVHASPSTFFRALRRHSTGCLSSVRSMLLCVCSLASYLAGHGEAGASHVGRTPRLGSLLGLLGRGRERRWHIQTYSILGTWSTKSDGYCEVAGPTIRSGRLRFFRDDEAHERLSTFLGRTRCDQL